MLRDEELSRYTVAPLSHRRDAYRVRRTAEAARPCPAVVESPPTTETRDSLDDFPFDHRPTPYRKNPAAPQR